MPARKKTAELAHPDIGVSGLDALIEQLLEHETLTKEEVDKILQETSGTAN